MMGVPLISKNCLEGTPFLPTGAIRVPSPAAGMTAITFIKGRKYSNFCPEGSALVSKTISIGPVIEKVHRYIAAQRMLQPGDRVAVAVSGGADSVALLRMLLELRNELGVVLSVAHFNHRIRGREADADEQFTKDLSAH